MILVSIRKAAEALTLSEGHIRRMISKGRWPYHRVGYRLIRLDLDEIKDITRRLSESSQEAKRK